MKGNINHQSLFKRDFYKAILGSVILLIVMVLAIDFVNILDRQWVKQCMTVSGDVDMACPKPQLLEFFELIDFPKIYFTYPSQFFTRLGLETEYLSVFLLEILSFYALIFYLLIKIIRFLKPKKLR